MLVVMLMWWCSCECDGVALGCPPPSWLPGVSFCGVGGVFGWVEGLLLCVEFVLVGGLCEGTRSDGIGMACERTRCGRLV